MKSSAILAVLLLLCACTTQTTSNPSRTATEELLISGAAEKAAAKLTLNVPPDSKVFVDASNFDGTDSKNAIAAIRTSLLKQGMRMAEDKKTADVVVEIRSGALSTDQTSFLIGIPSFSLPVPLASGALTIPEIAFYSDKDQMGVAKFAASGYNAKTGAYVASQAPRYGFTHNVTKTVLIFISWTRNEAYPADADDGPDASADSVQAPPQDKEFPLSR